MYNILKTRIAQGHRTVKFPAEPPVLPDRFKGLPAYDSAPCDTECITCVQTCPVNAIRREGEGVIIDLGRCIFCGVCERSCPRQAIRFTPEYRLASRGRDGLQVSLREPFRLAAELEQERLRLFARSLRLRQVSAGGCNACEADVNVLGTVVFDLARFGVQFVASPRHADGLLVTGPVTKNMELALRKTFDATPEPKIVIAVGACAVSGGMFAKHNEVCKGAAEIVPVDLFVPGCPPSPYTILDGILRLIGKIR